MLSFALALALQTPAETPSKTVWTQADLERVSDEIRVQVEDLRGMKFKAPVAVRLTDKKGFFEYALSRQEKTESPAKQSRDETTAKLLGLIPPSMDYQAEMLKILEEQVGGFYDPSSNTFFLMETFTGGVAKIILAHELTHALDDQYFDIDGTLAKCGEDTDATIAFQAVVEGSGTGLMNQWFLKHRKEVTPSDLEAAQNLGADILAEAPPYMWKPLLAVYLTGDSFLARRSGLNALMKAATTADVETAFKAPPRSSEQILHSKKYWDPDHKDEPLHVSVSADALPVDWQVAGVDTLGELYLGLLTTPLAQRKGLDLSNPFSVLAVEYTNEAAEGWGGDRLVLLRRGDDSLLQLVTAWDTKKDADEFAAALGESQKSPLIPVFSGPERTVEAGWVAGSTPTDVAISRETSADGKVALVVLRVYSLAEPMPAEELAKLRVPFSVTTPTK
ncbi:MAG: hypothetical protein SGI72_03365 [Planctomycetota bacterium]|nr:hypothetical protein [Planctomycetota bacterium]